MSELHLVRREEHRERFVTWFTGCAPGPTARETADLLWTTLMLAVDAHHVWAARTPNQIRIWLDWRLPIWAFNGPDWDTLTSRGVETAPNWKTLTIPVTAT